MFKTKENLPNGEARPRDQSWIVEYPADSFNSDLTHGFPKVVLGRTPVRTNETVARAGRIWADKVEKSKGAARPGNLLRYDGLEEDIKEGVPVIALSVMSYPDYIAVNGSLNNNGDTFNEQFFPYDYEINGNVIVPKIPRAEMLCSAFAFGVLVRTLDDKFAYLVRGSNVLEYQNKRSMPSGGQMGGDPQDFLIEAVNSSPNYAFEHNLAAVLVREFPGLERSQVIGKKFLGVARQLDLLDMVAISYARVDEFSFNLKPAEGKYSGIGFVPSTKDGLVELLQEGTLELFPASIQPVIALGSAYLGVDPTEVRPDKITTVYDK